MKTTRRAVFVCCDGLGRDWVTAAHTPVLQEIREASLWCADHRAVFPSVTRTSAASVATGTVAAHHGLHGNRMGLFEDGKITVRDVGKPDFRSHMRSATGRTLLVPTMAERVASAGGFVAFSNVSPGAAYFLDPEHFGHVYHRAGSFAPGGRPIGRPSALEVSHDLDGDWAMTQRFCTEILGDRGPVLSILWLANPDLTLHGNPLGSPAHLEALRQTGRCVREVFQTVERLRRDGEDILLLIGSDHGQETIGDSVDLEAWLAAQGLASLLAAGDVAVAGQGTAALLYATGRGRDPLFGVLEAMQRQPWADEVVAGTGLKRLGHGIAGGVVAAVNTARLDDANPYGVMGKRWVVAEPGKPTAIGCGQHGGWGADETRPFLIVNGRGVKRSAVHEPTSLADIAPTMLSFLGVPFHAVDGEPIAPRA
jgi:hypothetical protein